MNPTRLDLIPEFFNVDRTFSIFDTVQEHYTTTHGAICPGLNIEGCNDAELVGQLETLMRNAITSGDWSRILSPNRVFSRLDSFYNELTHGIIYSFWIQDMS